MLEQVQRYHELNQQRLALEKELEKLKADLKKVYQETTEVGDYTVCLTKQQRKSLDTEMVLRYLGKDRYVECEKVKEVEMFTVKKKV